jgi:histidinol phosphatase-like PHP family hydrolase
MKITTDWHIHSRNSCDEAAIVVSELIRSAAEQGIRHYGLTDHIHTPYNLPDIAASREEFLASQPPPYFHFGLEASCVSQWEIDEIATGKHKSPVYGLRKGGPADAALAIAITGEDLATYGVEYIVGGTHWPMYVPMEREAVIRDFHRQNMFLVTHPLVDIVAHPWWWHGHWKDTDGNYPSDPWLDDFRKVPAAMHDEFAAAAIQHETVVEINILAMLLNRHYPAAFKRQYLDYLAGLKERGVRLCTGSDCHSERYDVDFESAARMLESVGIRDEDLWRLPPGEGVDACKVCVC